MTKQMRTLLLALLLTSTAAAQTCPNRIQLQPQPKTSRGGTIIYKSNWNVIEAREATIAEGNHAQKGAALLVHYRAKRYIPSTSRMEIRTTKCKLVAYAGRFPRCTNNGCGEHERWYLRAPGGSYLTVSALEKRLGSKAALFRLRDRQWAVVQNIYSDREVAK